MAMRAASIRLKQLTGPSGNARARSLTTRIGPHGKKMCSSAASAGKVAAAAATVAAATVAAMFSVVRPKSTDDVVVADGERSESGRVVWGRRRLNELKCKITKGREENNVTEDGRLFDPEYEYLMVSDDMWEHHVCVGGVCGVCARGVPTSCLHEYCTSVRARFSPTAQYPCFSSLLLCCVSESSSGLPLQYPVSTVPCFLQLVGVERRQLYSRAVSPK